MPRVITIHPVLNGFVCSVGCKQVVCMSARELGDRITEYYMSPKACEANYLRNAINVDETPTPPEPNPASCLTGARQEARCASEVPTPKEEMPNRIRR